MLKNKFLAAAAALGASIGRTADQILGDSSMLEKIRDFQRKQSDPTHRRRHLAHTKANAIHVVYAAGVGGPSRKARRALVRIGELTTHRLRQLPADAGFQLGKPSTEVYSSSTLRKHRSTARALRRGKLATWFYGSVSQPAPAPEAPMVLCDHRIFG